MTRGSALVTALLITLATPATWPLALGAFLLRGGILVVTLPILVLPTPVGIGNAIGPAIISIALGTVPMVAVIVSLGIGVGLAAWLALGGWLAAALEAEGARLVARDEDLATEVGSTGLAAEGVPGRARANRPPTGDGRTAARILAARLIGLLPLAVVLVWASIRFVAVTYAELTLPSDTTTPIALRVLRGTPEVIVVLAIAWMAGEIVGAMAARRIVLRGEGVGRALRSAGLGVVHHPVLNLTRFWLPTLALVAVTVPSVVAAASAWTAVGESLGGRADPLTVLVGVVLFVGLWIGGLLLIAVASAWRAAVWTVAEVTTAGTFGGSTDRRPGDWRADPTSATL